MEKYLKKAKLQKNIAIGCLIFAFIALFAIVGDNSGENSMITGTVAIVITAMVLLAFSYNNIKKAQRMGNAGDDIVMAEKSGQVNNGWNKKPFLVLGGIFVAFFTIIVIMAVFVDTSKEEVGENVTVSGNKEDDKENADFGLTVSEYIENVEDLGVNNLEKVDVMETEDGGLGYLYSHGARQIVIYTRENGNVYSVMYHDGEFEHGVNQVSTTVTNLAAKFLAATGVDLSQNEIYSAIYEGILSPGSGNYYEFNDCQIGYSRTMFDNYESAWIRAK